MSSRKSVLELYKRLNKIVKEVFDQDVNALKMAKAKIRVEFQKNKDLDHQDEIEQKIKMGVDVGEILKKQVVQIVKKPEANVYELKLRKSTEKLDNTIFKPDAIIPPPRNKKCKDPS